MSGSDNNDVVMMMIRKMTRKECLQIIRESLLINPELSIKDVDEIWECLMENLK